MFILRTRLHGRRAKGKDPSGHNGYQYLLSFQLLKVRLMSGARTELINGGTSVHSVQGPCVCLYSLSPPKTTRMMGGVSCFKSIGMMRRPGPNPLSFSYHPSTSNYYIYIHVLHLHPFSSIRFGIFYGHHPPPLLLCSQQTTVSFPTATFLVIDGGRFHSLVLFWGDKEGQCALMPISTKIYLCNYTYKL